MSSATGLVWYIDMDAVSLFWLPLRHAKVLWYIRDPQTATTFRAKKAVFWLGIKVLTQISRFRLKRSKISQLIPHVYV